MENLKEFIRRNIPVEEVPQLLINPLSLELNQSSFTTWETETVGNKGRIPFSYPDYPANAVVCDMCLSSLVLYLLFSIGAHSGLA